MWNRPPRDERGGTLALIAVTLTGLMGAMSLAIDLGLLFTARSETQRLTDAAALAGASAFMDYQRNIAGDTASARALEFALAGRVRGRALQPTDIVVEVIVAEEKVRVTARSRPEGLFFARFLDRFLGGVATVSAAEAAPAGGANCVKPWAIPDLWDEQTGEDTNANRMWDVSPGNGNGGNGNGNGGSTESWDFDPTAGDRYQQWDRDNPDDLLATGLGSHWRYQAGSASQYDKGLQLTIKPQQPGISPVNPFFYVWRMPGSTGADDYRENILSCHPEVVTTTVPYPIEPGNMNGPTRQGVNTLIDRDPNAFWNGQEVAGTSAGHWRNSPRVFVAPLFDPTQIAGITGGGNLDLTFSDFGLFFLEGPKLQNPHDHVYARFLGFARGNAAGGGAGQLAKILRLVE